MGEPAPNPTTSPLPPYGGKLVMRTVLSVRNAGDGLSEGMAIDPELLPIGAKVQVVLDCVVTAHNHKPLRGGTPDYLELEQVLSAGTAVIIDADVVVDALDQQRTKLSMAKEAKEGKGHLQGTGYDDDMFKAHTDGLHADAMVPGCVECDAERAAAAKEAADLADQAPVPIGRGRRKVKDAPQA